jgi:hypothetical protein
MQGMEILAPSVGSIKAEICPLRVYELDKKPGTSRSPLHCLLTRGRKSIISINLWVITDKVHLDAIKMMDDISK